MHKEKTLAPEPVSYTHLDVYKRQPVDRPRRDLQRDPLQGRVPMKTLAQIHDFDSLHCSALPKRK